MTAPFVVEALRRLLAEPQWWRGVVAAGELGDARSFLQSLAPRHLRWNSTDLTSPTDHCDNARLARQEILRHCSGALVLPRARRPQARSAYADSLSVETGQNYSPFVCEKTWLPTCGLFVVHAEETHSFVRIA